MTDTRNIKPLMHERKTDALRRELRQLAREHNAQSKLPTVRELAKAYAVSIATLDRVLRELETEGVLERRHGVGIFVGKSVARHTIGLVYDRNIFEDFSSPFPRMLVDAASKRAKDKGEEFHLYLDLPTHFRGVPGRAALLDDVEAGRLDGVIYCGRYHQQTIDQLMAKQVPLVVYGYGKLPVPYRFVLDVRHTVRQAIKAMSQRGCKRVAMLTAYDVLRRTQPDFTEDLEGFWQSCKLFNVGTATPPIWSLDANLSSDAKYEDAGYQMVMKMARKKKLPCDGLFVTNDMVTRGVLRAMAQLGITPGRDIQLVTHANRDSPALTFAPTGVILLELDPHQLAISAFDLLESVIAGQERRPREVLVQSTLRVQKV